MICLTILPENEIQSVFNKLNNMNNDDKKDWDRNDVINRITDTGDWREFMVKLNQLVDLYDNHKTAIEIINEIR